MRYVLLNIEHSQVKSSNVCVKRFTDMPWSTCSRVVHKKWGKYFFPRKRLTIFGLFDGLWSVGTRFRHYFILIAPIQGVLKKKWSCHSTVHGRQYATKNLVCNFRIDGARGIRGGGNFRRLS